MSVENTNIQTSVATEQLADPFLLPPSLVEPNLMPILEARYREAHLCLERSPLATIMLCGSLLEGILLGIAQKRPKDFNSAPQVPKSDDGKPKKFGDWSLAQFIDVAHALDLLPLDTVKLSHALRDFRNYIHPNQQLKEKFNPNRYTAEACLAAVKSAIRHFNQHVTVNPKEQQKKTADWTEHSDATYLALVVLIGAWNEKSPNDMDAVSRLLGISYQDWLTKACEILQLPDSPLTLNNGIWQVSNRAELWHLLGARLLDQNLDTFKALAVSVLKEPDPAFELPPGQRSAASLYGKKPKFSPRLCRGIAEGLAILGSHPEACVHCSLEKAEVTVTLVIRELLTNADWALWASLGGALPPLAEAAPDEFLDAVENALSADPCPFDELFAQEGQGFNYYLSDLLWALEGLAWDEQYLVRVCAILGELASHDPGGRWANRPSNSLASILFPSCPQTQALFAKRQTAVQKLLDEFPAIAWKLLLQLLPGQYQVISGTYQPRWRKTIPDDWKKGVTTQEYLEQVLFYSEMAVKHAGNDPTRLAVLVRYLPHLPRVSYDQILNAVTSRPVIELPEEQRLQLWEKIVTFIIDQKRYSDRKLALDESFLAELEKIKELLAPTTPFNLYRYLFSNNDFYLYESSGNLEEEQKKLGRQREKAVSEIVQATGAEGIIRFADSVEFPHLIGEVLGLIADSAVEQTLLMHLLDSDDNKRQGLVGGFIWRRHKVNGWAWCDRIDKAVWSPQQKGQFLAYLPFAKGAWDRASEWLSSNEQEYWSRTSANAYQTEGDIADLAIAVGKLLEFGRPRAAIICLGVMLHNNQHIDPRQCIQALLAACGSKESGYPLQDYHFVELIKFLQADSTVSHADLWPVELAYLCLLDRDSGSTPQCLEKELSNKPEFFCKIIRLLYKSKKEEQIVGEPPEQLRELALNLRELLHIWRTVPGMRQDGAFDEARFTEWLHNVKESCTESGHLEVALNHIGEVLVYAPPDPGGLWIHRTIAAVLEGREHEAMRDGFRSGTINARGFHRVDPSGAPERDLAEQFREKAKAVDDAGFCRFAVTLQKLAKGYDYEAERIIAEHKRDGE